MVKAELTNTELNTVLAALRHWQRSFPDGDEERDPPDDLWDIASNTEAWLDDEEIDALCERLNTQPAPKYNPYDRRLDP
jgi:hypothetical protein